MGRCVQGRRKRRARPTLPAGSGRRGGAARTLRATRARHPAVEALLEQGDAGGGVGGGAGRAFVANDFALGDGVGEGDDADLRSVVLTGPNMGGKSCYVRTAGVLVVLAQMGSWVPCASATIGMFDKILTRMGGEDDLLAGRSTFESELLGVGGMLRGPGDGGGAHGAAASSGTSRRQTLLLLDELGRGTSTYDGMAIACATLEHIVNRMQCLCYFVTHYPLVTRLAVRYPGCVANGHMGYLVDEDGGAGAGGGGGDGGGGGHRNGNDATATAAPPRIVFLYEFRNGAAGGSYGLNVARLAGVDANILALAAEKAKEAERWTAEGETGTVWADQVLGTP